MSEIVQHCVVTGPSLMCRSGDILPMMGNLSVFIPMGGFTVLCSCPA